VVRRSVETAVDHEQRKNERRISERRIESERRKYIKDTYEPRFYGSIASNGKVGINKFSE